MQSIAERTGVSFAAYGASAVECVFRAPKQSLAGGAFLEDA